MILTGRTGLLALICVLPIALSPWPARAFVMLLVALAVAVTVDTLLAASTRKLRFTRSPYTSARLGQPVDASLLLCNGGRRRFRGQVRDAWPPSARAQPHTHDVDVAAGQRQQVHTALRPVRRGDQRAAMVTARSIGPLGLAGRQSSQSVPGLVRVLPPFLSRKHLPSRLAKLREIDGLLPTLIRGQGTEFDSLREYVVGDDVRSIDWRASARRADVMVRTWRPERDRRVESGRVEVGQQHHQRSPPGAPQDGGNHCMPVGFDKRRSQRGHGIDQLGKQFATRGAKHAGAADPVVGQEVDMVAGS